MLSYNDKKRTLRVALYLRVSSDDQADHGYGLDLQEESIRNLIKSKGTLPDGEPVMVLAGKGREHIYVDDGYSGTLPIEERPGFARLKEALIASGSRGKPFDLVAVYKIDRFARKLSILIKAISFFEEQGISFVSANESIDTSTPFGRAMLGIMGVIAELEIETIKMRTVAGRKQAIGKGVYMGAYSPFGYEKDADKKLKMLDQEAKVVKMIFNWFTVDKLSTQEIADELQAQKILSPEESAERYEKSTRKALKKNKPYFWRSQAVKNIISNEIYIGKYFYGKSKNGTYLPKSEWKLSKYRTPTIIDDATFHKAQSRLRNYLNIASSIRTSDEHIYQLSGLLRCDECSGLHESYSLVGGKKKISKGRNKGKYTYYYACTRKNKKKYSDTCDVIPVPAEGIEDYVVEFVKDLLKDPKAVYEYQKKLTSTKQNTEVLQTQINHYKELLNARDNLRVRIKNLYKFGETSLEEFKNNIAEQDRLEKEWEDKLKELEIKFSKAGLANSYSKTIEAITSTHTAVLEDIFKSKKQTRDLLKVLIDEIKVYSRDVIDSDKIAGRKKEGQKIPHRITIKLNLPREIINSLAEARFGVQNSNL